MDSKGIKIDGWIARDEDGSLGFHHSKPYRTDLLGTGVWVSNSGYIRLPEVLEEPKWENEPVSVEVTLDIEDNKKLKNK